MPDKTTPDDESLTDRLRGAWRSGSEASRGTAETAGGAVGTVLALLAKLLAMAVDGTWIFLQATVLKFLNKLPKVDIGDGLIVAGHKMKLGNADAIVNVIYGDGMVKPRSATWQSEETAFKTDNDEMFYAKGIGYNPKRMNGKVPVVWALRVGSEITEPLEAAIANARRHGRFRPFTRASGESDVAVDLDADRLDEPPGVGPRREAATDGGVATDAAGAMAGPQRTINADTDDPYDGMIVSFRDGYELFGSKVTQEDMQAQETRGKLAVLDWERRDQLKLALMLLAAVALGLFGPAIAQQIAGAASGAGSGGFGVGGGGGFGLFSLPGVLF